jgi:hypothetical protein
MFQRLDKPLPKGDILLAESCGTLGLPNPLISLAAPTGFEPSAAALVARFFED